MQARVFSRSYRAAFAAGLLTLLAAPLAAAGAVGSTPTNSGLPPSPPAYQPGDQVWTDSGSVPPPGTTVISFVAPDPDVVQVILTPIRPYQPGDKVWTSSAQVPAPAQPDANGCQRVPSSGYIGHNVYDSTTYEYSNYWYWSGGSSNESFSWYIRRSSDDMIMAHGSSPGGGGSQAVNANILRWQVQNTGSDPQAWNACYEVL